MMSVRSLRLRASPWVSPRSHGLRGRGDSFATGGAGGGGEWSGTSAGGGGASTGGALG
ncbi:MAG: hypothetical protein R3F14_43330 [Polyangiaceae bacterium]